MFCYLEDVIRPLNSSPLVFEDDQEIASQELFVGAKAAILSQLRMQHLPVPELVVVTTLAFRRHLRDVGIANDEALQLSPEGHPSIAVLADRIKGTSVRPDLATVILKAYRGLRSAGRPQDWLAAVRSSSSAEDGRFASYAGQFETVLAVTEASLLDAVRLCWASSYSSRSVVYRGAMSNSQEPPKMAVIIQRQVLATKAGVLFTAHPLSADKTLAYVEANFGTGESVVNGLVIPDAAVLSKNDLCTVDYTVGNKSVMTAATPGPNGARLIQQPPDQVTARVLTDAELRGLCELAITVESLLGSPQDIEWAIDEAGKPWILQARPITA